MRHEDVYAEEREKFMILTAKPTNPTALKVADLAAAVNVGDKATKAGTYVPDTALDASEAMAREEKK